MNREAARSAPDRKVGRKEKRNPPHIRALNGRLRKKASRRCFQHAMRLPGRGTGEGGVEAEGKSYKRRMCQLGTKDETHCKDWTYVTTGDQEKSGRGGEHAARKKRTDRGIFSLMRVMGVRHVSDQVWLVKYGDGKRA